jgi:hypothetical protein
MKMEPGEGPVTARCQERKHEKSESENPTAASTMKIRTGPGLNARLGRRVGDDETRNPNSNTPVLKSKNQTK